MLFTALPIWFQLSIFRCLLVINFVSSNGFFTILRFEIRVSWNWGFQFFSLNFKLFFLSLFRDMWSNNLKSIYIYIYIFFFWVLEIWNQFHYCLHLLFASQLFTIYFHCWCFLVINWITWVFYNLIFEIRIHGIGNFWVFPPYVSISMKLFLGFYLKK